METVNFNYMKSIYNLANRLNEANIPFVINCFSGGFQIAYPDNGANRKCSVVLHNGSYGHSCNSFEIMGLLTDEESVYDSVVGYLTEDDVFNRIYNHYYNREEE